MSRDKLLRIAWVGLLALTLLLVAGIRLRLLTMPLERDEGEYAYAGQLLLDGVPPYQNAYNMKFPGTYAAYALLMALFGETAAGIRLGLLAVNFAAIALLFVFARGFFGNTGACAAAAAYSVLSLLPSTQGFAGHATHFVVPPVLAAFVLLRKPHNGRVIASGLLFGIAVLMKQPGAVFALLGLIWLFYLDTRAQIPAIPRFARAAGFTAGVLLPFALTCALLWRAGVFERFWFWTIQYASEYGTQTSPAEALHNLGVAFHNAGNSELLLGLIALLGLILCIATCRSQPRLLLPSFLAAAAAAASAGFYFRPHYFILLLPPLALLVGVVAKRAAEAKSPLGRYLVPLFVAAAIVAPFIDHRIFLFQLAPVDASRHIYGRNPFPEAARIAEYIRENSSSNDTIAVMGSEPEIYFYSKRRSATGHIYTYALMEPHRYASRLQQEMAREIEAAKPRFVVFVSIAASWSRRDDSDPAIFSWFDQYAARELQPVGYVGVHSDQPTQYYLPFRGEPLRPTDAHLTIWERRQ